MLTMFRYLALLELCSPKETQRGIDIGVTIAETIQRALAGIPKWIYQFHSIAPHNTALMVCEPPT